MRWFGLKGKFICAIAGLYLLVGGLTLWIFVRTATPIIDSFAQRYAGKEALLEKHKLMAVIEREVILARKMADDPALRAWAADVADPNRRAQADAALASFGAFFRDRMFFVALADSRHYYVSTSIAPLRTELVLLEPDKPADQWFFSSLRTLDDYALNLDYNRTLHEAKIWINAVMYDRDQRKIGLCGTGLNITRFLEQIVLTREDGVTTILIDRNGVIQAHADRAIVEHNASHAAVESKITLYKLFDHAALQRQLEQAIERLARGNSTVESFPAQIGGRDQLLAVTALPEVGWFNVVLVDVAKVISLEDFFPIALLLGVSLLLVLIAVALLLNRMVLRPLRRLTTASQTVASGCYEVALPAAGNDELGILTTTFGSMTATILDHTRNLEEKVQERTRELAVTNRELETAQQRVNESIHYAQLIQSSILPSAQAMDRALGEHFVLYRPKDIVGGDFYYLREYPDYCLLACIDCTGHGVPGAFVTMTVNAVLGHVLDVVCNNDPGRILAELDRALRQTLRLRDIDAGLDIALCYLEQASGRLLFAGAGLSLWHVRAATLQEARGDRQRLGYRGGRAEHLYRNHELWLQPGDLCALASDGLLDAPGGEKGYGFGRERCQTLLAEHDRLPLPALGELMEERLGAWCGAFSQRDDITLLVFRYQPLASSGRNS